jgi:hypothetical protein
LGPGFKDETVLRYIKQVFEEFLPGDNPSIANKGRKAKLSELFGIAGGQFAMFSNIFSTLQTLIHGFACLLYPIYLPTVKAEEEMLLENHIAVMTLFSDTLKPTNWPEVVDFKIKDRFATNVPITKQKWGKAEGNIQPKSKVNKTVIPPTTGVRQSACLWSKT